MIFWYGFISFCICVLFLNIHLKNKYITDLFVFVLWVISSFRYMIGPDYDMYTDIYYYGETIFAVLPIEPSFQYLVLWLNDLGLEAQALFLVYSTFSIYIFYFAVRKILKNERQVVISMVLFAVNQNMYWFSMSGIRQAAAISITMYLVICLINKRRDVYLVGLILNFFIHYSSIVCLVLIFIKRKSISLGQYFSMVISGYILGYLKVLPFLFTVVIGNWDSEYNKYSYYINQLLDGATYTFNPYIFIDALFLGIVLYYMEYRRGKEAVIINIASFYIFTSIISSYYIVDLSTRDMITRFSLYFMPCYLLSLVLFVDFLFLKYKNEAFTLMLIMFYSLMFLRGLSLYDHNQEGMSLPSRSNANINYEMNFKFLK